jgi:tripartite-type tricarboxylate transporter receptor subunit TctC
MPTRRQFVRSAAALAALSAQSTALRAQSFEAPRIVNGFPAGGTADQTSRLIADRIGGSAYARTAGVVENKVGAGGRIACETVRAAKPDGSTLLLTPYSCMSIYPHIYSRLSYDPTRDFVPVSIVAVMTHALAVGPMVPAGVKTVRDYLAWAKANPDKANYGSPAAGSTPHFLAALLGLNNGVELKHVPYRGSLPAIADMIGGTLASASTPTGDALANHKAGKIRILATSGATRSPFAPEVPTYAEQGFPELTADEWFGIYAPARTPENVVANANAAINAALRDKAVIDALAVSALVARGSSPADMERSQKEELTRWGPVVKRIGFTAES